MTRTVQMRSSTTAVLLLGLMACSDTKDPVAPALAFNGLKFELSGANITSLSAPLPTADATFAPPVLAVNRAPSTTAPATVTVSAAEPFTQILVLPSGGSTYARITLPAATQLVGLSVTYEGGGAVVSTGITVAVVSGSRTSRSSSASLQTLGN
jgi:hypothetical protein